MNKGIGIILFLFLFTTLLCAVSFQVTVQSQPEGLTGYPFHRSFTQESVIQLQARPIEGYLFQYWLVSPQ